MGWKKWPSWLKGGVIGGIISIILNLIQLLLVISESSLAIFAWTFLFPAIPFIWDFKDISTIVIFSIIINLVVYFFIGAIIGWIIGKIKKK